MNNSSKKKLASITALSAAFLAIPRQAECQVIYTDFDLTLGLQSTVGLCTYGGWTEIDINNDSNADFTVAASCYCSAGFTSWDFTVYDPTWIPGGWMELAGGHNGLEAGQQISAGFRWESGEALLAERARFGGGSIDHGDFADTMRYLGIQIPADSGFHYGWIRLKYEMTPTTVRGLIRGYAYEATPDFPILAGDTVGNCNIKPPKLKITNLTPTSATIEWQTPPPSMATEVQYRIRPPQSGSGATPSTVVTSPGANLAMLTGLQPNTQYQVRIRHLCGTTQRPIYKHRGFVTPTLRIPAGMKNIEVYSFGNTVHINLSASDGTAEILDISGRVLKHQQLLEGSNRIHLDNFSAGIYLVRIQTGGEHLIKKVYIEPRQ